MSLNQHIEGRHGECQPCLKIRPAPMHDLFEMAHERQHGEHRLDEHTVLPLAARTQFEWPFLLALPKSAGLPPLTRLQNRTCRFRVIRLLSGAALVKSTIAQTGSSDWLSALHTYLGTKPGFMSYACLLTTRSSTPPLPRQHILSITPSLGFLGDPSSTSACG